MTSIFVSNTVLILVLGFVLQQFFPVSGNRKQGQYFNQQKWTIWHAIVVLLLDAYSIVFLTRFLIDGLEHSINPFWTRFLVPLWTAGILFIFFRLLNDSIKSVGLSLENTGSGIVLGLKSFLGLFVIVNVLFALSTDFGNHLQEIGAKWGERLEIQGIFWSYLFIAINCVFLSLYAFQEEIIFRGIFYGAIRQHLPPIPSIILNAYFFSIFHDEFSVMVLFLGILLAYMYEKFRTLLPVAIFHSLWNCFLTINQTIGIPFDLNPFYYYVWISIGSLAILVILKSIFRTQEKM